MDGLRVVFQTKTGPVVGVENLSLSIFPGETVCLVGESGSGKSVSSLALMRGSRNALFVLATVSIVSSFQCTHWVLPVVGLFSSEPGELPF